MLLLTYIWPPLPILPFPSGKQHTVVCIFVFYIQHMSEIIRFLPFSVWLTSISIMPSRSIYVVANGTILSFFFFLAEHYSLYHFFIQPSVNWLFTKNFLVPWGKPVMLQTSLLVPFFPSHFLFIVCCRGVEGENGTIFALSPKFWYIVFWFSFVSIF